MGYRIPDNSPFLLKLKPPTLLGKALSGLVGPVFERVSGLRSLARVYHERLVPRARIPGVSFTDASLSAFKVSYSLEGEGLEELPEQGPVVVVANHPFGGIEGVVVLDILRRRRPDSKVLANFILSRFPEAEGQFIFVDPFGNGSSSTKSNLRPIREAMQFVRSGGALGIFPSGTVSHLHVRDRTIKDPAWSDTVARIIKNGRASVLPVYFKGHNGWLFQLLGLIHPRLRTMLLPRELVNKEGKALECIVGSLIPFEKLDGFNTDRELMSYVRLRTYILGKRDGERSAELRRLASEKSQRVLEPVVAPHDHALIVQEVDKLSERHFLAEQGELRVLVARADEIPEVLFEIGRLRELSFRKVGEGTGRATDLDKFDDYYEHMFVWNTEKKELVGAYRLARTDEVLPRHGISGLYTSTLFHYRRKLLESLGPALELGRSFVREEYQRNYTSLLMLWKGIGAYVARNPQYRYLFGPVSINNNYDSLSRQLIAKFLEENEFLSQYKKLVRAKNPLPPYPMSRRELKAASTVVRTLDEVNELVSEIEREQQGVPILLKQYLRLGGKLLGFNVDPEFGDVLDGLILVDLVHTELRVLERYLGKTGAEGFLNHHKGKQAFSGRNGGRLRTGPGGSPTP